MFDRPIGQNQAIAHPLARAWAELEAAELLAYKAAWLFDPASRAASRPTPPRCSPPTPASAPATPRCRPCGGFGYSREFHVERLWREIRLFKIAPITQEMVLNYLAEHVLGLPKSY